MLLEPTGVILQEWLRDIPNEGLICFHDLFNVERVVPTSPKALAELLSTKAYDFEKPPNIRSLLGNIQGFGLLVAEGENHKVRWALARCRKLSNDKKISSSGSI